jgi:hypothetical protein
MAVTAGVLDVGETLVDLPEPAAEALRIRSLVGLPEVLA